MLDTTDITEQQLFVKLLHSAIGLLARREHSSFELAQKLKHKLKQYDLGGDGVVHRVLEQMIADGYLSDQRYAEAYSRSRINKGFGFDRIAHELMAKGISSELITTTFNALKENDGELSVIAHAWQKKFNQAPRDLNEKMKQMRFLFYRGFKQAEIQRFFAELE
jgi:regulatory protein